MVASCAWWVLAGMLLCGAIMGGSLVAILLGIAVAGSIEDDAMDEFLGRPPG